MSTIGYARVSTRDQNPDCQEHARLEAGAARVYIDHGDSSRVRDRPQWLACLDYVRPGDTLLVHRLDRVSGEWPIFQIPGPRRGPFNRHDSGAHRDGIAAAGRQQGQIAKVLGAGRMSVSRALAKFDGGSRRRDLSSGSAWHSQDGVCAGLYLILAAQAVGKAATQASVAFLGGAAFLLVLGVVSWAVLIYLGGARQTRTTTVA